VLVILTWKKHSNSGLRILSSFWMVKRKMTAKIDSIVLRLPPPLPPPPPFYYFQYRNGLVIGCPGLSEMDHSKSGIRITTVLYYIFCSLFPANYSFIRWPVLGSLWIFVWCFNLLGSKVKHTLAVLFNFMCNIKQTSL
jgi:hypothetical protein